MAYRVNPFDDALRQALATVSRARTYNPGIGAFETASTQEIIAEGWHGEYRWPVRMDPIFTPIFTAILGSGGFTLFGTTVSYAAIASAIATTAIVAGVQYLLTPKPPKPEDGRAPLTQPIPYRFWGVGEARLAGAMMLWEAVDNRMYSVQAIVGHRINAYTGYYLNDDKVELDGNTVISPDGDRYNDADPVRIYRRLGLTPETAIAEIVADLGAEGVWTSDHRGDGQASVGMTCNAPGAENFQKRFPYGKPALSVVAELALVWDFRDPAQDPEDPETWAFSKNSALVLAWHECFNPFGTKRDFRKALLPVLDMWQEEADVCDEDVPRAAGGTEKRYECGGFDTTDHDPKSGTNAILASCDGWMCERGDGALLFVAGKFREKYVATLTDADIVGHTVQHDVLFEEEVNQFIPKFTYPATDFTTTDTDFFEDTPAQIEAGRVLPQDGNYIWVQQWRQARRLGKREFARLREKKRGTFDVRFTGINAVYAPWVRLATPRRLPSMDGKLIANRRSALSVSRGGFQMTWIKMPGSGPEIDDWNPAVDEGAAPPVPAKPVSDGIPKPIIDTAAAISGSGTVYIRLALVDPNRSDLTPALRYRVADVGGGVPGAWIEQKFPGIAPDAGLIVLNTNPVPADTSIDIEAVYIGSNGSYGDYSDSETVVSTVDNTPPAAVSGVVATGGVGQVALTWNTPNSGNYVATNIRRNTVNNEGAATVVRTEYGAPSSSDAWINTPLAAGTYYYWLRSVNGSGVESTSSVATGPKVVT
ncbi:MULTISPECIES: hypothetical protein [unclassified Mesorhizobium]|uniref:hypothetical protein n=1 Tax=unclassified Mesorhizobium TaxID=325217 RepID=UPI00112CC42D|nr:MULTISPECIES: hypothetical protein [unclassified Mesorhizobium]TPK42317.1 hypothetical protein FJ550_30245 [Mesorhizobium sp. B2-5-2]TPL44488.1 hypothetical protein FJ961_03895 [Mesorhizobium sp. B2-4-5]TPM68675.1 hypothetical protein FJ968_29700 [Mesorhizobium sp. B2-1-6]TPN71765.1 hypothetical protein FJ985_30750 [Mesorhizobium sp. B1-1-2]